MDFLDPNNTCGITLLKIVSRGNAIIAELLRLSENVPQVFLLENAAEKAKYGPILFDFAYLRQADELEATIQGSVEMCDLDDEFRENHIVIIERFYKLFDSIYRYMKDFHKYLSDLEEGVFIQHTFEGVLFNPDGKQLMAEAVYLFGVMLLLLDQRIDGLIRERMLVSYIRYKGESDIANIDQVCKLCRRTGWSTAPGAKRPANYPEDYFGRFPFPDEVPEMIIGRLRSDDIYQQISAYPNPAHRSTALATQAGMLYVILYFTPDILNNEAAIMREIVDKHFNDNWVVSFFMGHTVDLSLQWVPYQAAKTALMNTLVASNVKSVQEKHVKKIEPLLEKIAHYLEEGVLTDEAVLDTSAKLLQTQREANVTIRWLMLHLTTKHKKLLEAVVVDVNLDRVLLLLLNVAQFEYILKGMFQRLLDTKQARWDEFKKQACERVTELSEYFSGEKALTRVAKDEQLMAWFKDIADKISSLDYHDSTLAGRKIQQLSLALEEVESFHQIETNVHVKHFLGETRGFLMQMVRTVNCKEEILMVITLVSDISYARDIISDYIPMMQERIKRDPSSTLKLRSTFLKLATCLELPCVRIDQAKSPDLVSVMEYYSSSLVSFVRSVLQVVPSTMFTILNEIIDLTINSLKELPTRLPRAELRELAQLEERHTLARATHQIAVFTEGILAMETTFVGIIKVDPEQLLEDGIRRELVRQIANAMHQSLVFKHTRPGEFEGRLGELAHRLEGFRRSFEYCQDYLGLYALRVWQEEFSRIVNYNVEQECNSFLKKKVYDWASTYQSDSIPIPRLPPLDTDSVNFMGRLTREILLQTDSRRATYVDQLASWIDPAGNEIVGLRTFGAIHKSVGTFGLTGIDKLLCFMIVRDLREFTKLYRKHIDGQLNQFLVDYANEVAPLSTIPYNMARAIPRALNATSKLWPAFILDITTKVGQMQLIRRSIANELNFSCKLDSYVLHSALEAFNTALIGDIRAHYRSPATNPYPSDDNPLLPEISTYLETSGISHPFTKIYITTEPLDSLPLVLFLFTLSQMPKLEYQPALGTMWCKVKNDPLDEAPLVVGIITILKQFHFSVTQTYVSYAGQYIRGSVNFASTSKETSKNHDFPPEVVNLLHFLEDFCRLSHTSRKVVEAHVPSYIFDQYQSR